MTATSPLTQVGDVWAWGRAAEQAEGQRQAEDLEHQTRHVGRLPEPTLKEREKRSATINSGSLWRKSSWGGGGGGAGEDDEAGIRSGA